MHILLSDKNKWLDFALEHNASANPNAIQLNGSKSYTLVAIHLAADLPIPKSVMLDLKRAQGKFISDHFDGLRRLYESNIPSGNWLPAILEQCRMFAHEHSIESDVLIHNLLAVVDKNTRAANRSINKVSSNVGNKRQSSRPLLSFPLKPVVKEIYDDDDIKI